MNNENFNKALSQTLKNEGVVNGRTGYINNKVDSGGETIYGITISKARECGYLGLMREMPFSTAKEIYYREFWLKTNADNIKAFNIAFLLFDFSVNSGVSNACKKMQKTLNKVSSRNELKIDGIIGVKTLEKLNDYLNKKEYYHYYNNKLEKVFISEILSYYTSLGKFNIFGKGWINRIIKNMDFLNNV